MKKIVDESFVKRIQLCQCSAQKNTQQTDFENQTLLDRNELQKLVFLSYEVLFTLCGNETAKITDIGVPKFLMWFMKYLYMTVEVRGMLSAHKIVGTAFFEETFLPLC
jgi:hypothetical protein